MSQQQMEQQWAPPGPDLSGADIDADELHATHVLDEHVQVTRSGWTLPLDDVDHLGKLLGFLRSHGDAATFTYRHELLDTHISRRDACTSGGFAARWDCGEEECDRGEEYEPAWIKLPCSSWFCGDCQEHRTRRRRENLKDVVMDVRHRYGVFTVPPAVAEQLSMDTSMTALYAAVRRALTRYFDYGGPHQWPDGYRLDPAVLMFPHSYGSQSMAWHPHMNIALAGRAAAYRRHRCGDVGRRGHDVDACEECGEEFVGFRDLSPAPGRGQSPVYVDYEELEQLYREELQDAFDVDLDGQHIQFNFDEKGDGDDDEPGLPPAAVLDKLLDYVSRLPIDMDDVHAVTSEGVTFTTHKREQQGMDPLTVSRDEFYQRIVQHIPSPNLKLFRLYGPYAGHHDHSGEYDEVGGVHEAEQPECACCGGEMGPSAVISSGRLVFIDAHRLDLQDLQAGDIDEHIGKRVGNLPDRLQEVVDPPDDIDFRMTTTADDGGSGSGDADAASGPGPRERVRRFLDGRGPVDVGVVIDQASVAERVVDDMTRSGDIYEPRAGKVSIL